MRNYIEELKDKSITQSKIDELKDKKMSEWFEKLKNKKGTNLKYAFDNLIKKYNKISNGGYKCESCDFKTNNGRSWTQHIKSSIHIAKMNEDEIIKCKGCGREFIPENYEDHILFSKSCYKKNHQIAELKIQITDRNRELEWKAMRKRIYNNESNSFTETERLFYNKWWKYFNDNWSILKKEGLIEKNSYGLLVIRKKQVALDFS